MRRTVLANLSSHPDSTRFCYMDIQFPASREDWLLAWCSSVRSPVSWLSPKCSGL